MLYKNEFNENLDYVFKSYMGKSESNRLAIYQRLAAFYFNDYMAICDILKKETLNNPFSEETLKTIRIQHINILKKTINKLTSGIYTIQPSRFLDIESKRDYKSENQKFDKILKSINYNIKIKEAFKQSKYFNTVIVMPVYDYTRKKLRLDIYNPCDFIVKTTDDHNELHSIAIRKADKDGMIYYSIWTPEQHFILKGGKKIPAVNNPDMINPFSPLLPLSVLRMNEGIDFYGEPNWNLYLNQLYFDIRLTDFDRSELNSIYQIWFGVNTFFKENETFVPNQIKQINNVSESDVLPTLQSISQDVDYTNIRDNIDWKIKTMMNSEGLSANTVNTDIYEQSGVSKLVDEIELQEQKEDDKHLLKSFEIDLMNKIRMVYNYYSPEKINPDSEIKLEWSRERFNEPVSDTKIRREMQKEYGYKNEVDFAIEDLDMTEDEAIKRIEYIAKQNVILKKINESGPESDTSEDVIEDDNRNF